MALSQPKLKSGLLDWMLNKEAYITKHESFVYLLNKYEEYILDAVDISGDPPDVYFKNNALTILDTLTYEETHETAAQKWENAFIAFWESGSFLVSTPPSGTISPEISANITTNIIPGPLKNELKTIFQTLDFEATYETKAEDIATALDTATKTIIVTCVGTHPAGGTLAVSGNIS